jgi:8-oxo-dGTP diphosphatase
VPEQTVLCLITRTCGSEPQVLLGLKKAGFGTGRWVGLGGHLEEGEKPAEAAAREVMEESGVEVAPDTMAHVASLLFLFPTRQSWDQNAEVYLTRDFRGEPAESAEISPRWFAQTELPLSGMWDDAKYWLPLVLASQRVRATITFGADCATVERIDWQPYEFPRD